MYDVYFTSDLHFSHQRDFLYVPRGFDSIEEHNETIVKNWNSVVRPQDYVYILGDIMLNDDDTGIKLINRLNGAKYLIRGNHDSEDRLSRYYTETDLMSPYGDVYPWAAPVHIGKWSFYLSHYPVCFSDYRSAKQSRKWCLCGHSHTKNKWQNINTCCYHVELDCHNNTPVSIDEIMTDLNWFKSLSPEKQEEIINGNI